MDKVGKFLQNVGLAQIANSPFSMPDPSGKIWTPVQLNERKTHAPHVKRKDIKKYDWMPKGEKINPGNTRGSPVQDYRYKKLRGREAHWARRPKYNQGIYSQPTQSEIHYHQKSQMRRGQAKFGLGTSMRFLGRGLLAVQLGVYASWLYDDPSEQTVTKIVKDLTLVDQIDQTFWQPLQWLNEKHVSGPSAS